MVIRVVMGVLAAAFSAPAAAGEFLAGGNSGTLARSFALPTLGDWDVLERGAGEWRVAVDVTNEYAIGGATCARECIVLDAETTRLRLTHRRPLGAGWDALVDVAYLHPGGGFLDGWIQEWHGWFGLPNGGRELTADDQYRIRYERDGTVLLDRRDGRDGIGDVGVGVGRRLGHRGAVRALAKLPTGDAERLTGGNAGGAVWLDLALTLPPGWDGYVAGGLSFNARGDVLPEQQNRTVLFGGVGVLAPLTRHVRLHLQLQGHTRLYEDSEVAPLARPGLPLTVGLQVRRSDGRAALDLGFQEDPSVNGSPDFAAYTALTVRSR